MLALLWLLGHTTCRPVMPVFSLTTFTTCSSSICSAKRVLFLVLWVRSRKNTDQNWSNLVDIFVSLWSTLKVVSFRQLATCHLEKKNWRSSVDLRSSLNNNVFVAFCLRCILNCIRFFSLVALVHLSLPLLFSTHWRSIIVHLSIIRSSRCGTCLTDTDIGGSQKWHHFCMP